MFRLTIGMERKNPENKKCFEFRNVYKKIGNNFFFFM